MGRLQDETQRAAGIVRQHSRSDGTGLIPQKSWNSGTECARQDKPAFFSQQTQDGPHLLWPSIAPTEEQNTHAYMYAWTHTCRQQCPRQENTGLPLAPQTSQRDPEGAAETAPASKEQDPNSKAPHLPQSLQALLRKAAKCGDSALHGASQTLQEMAR